MSDEVQVEQSAEIEHEGGVTTSQWEFIDRIPTPDDVATLLATLPAVYGVHPKNYAEYVVGLPSVKKMKVPEDGKKVERFYDVVTLYMGVAGRMKMLNDAAEMNGWRVDFVPEPVTPTGVPGMLQMDDRIVYREYVEITTLCSMDVDGQTPECATSIESGQCLGRRSGTAWVPSTGGRQAAGSNPYEKVETAARGRAIAAWGFGVLPGSGVASLEEMLGRAYNRQALTKERDPEKVQVRMGRAELIENLGMEMEIVRQMRGVEQEEMLGRIAEYVERTFGVEEARVVEDGVLVALDWAKLKDGMLQLTLNQLMATKMKLEDQQRAV